MTATLPAQSKRTDPSRSSAAVQAAAGGDLKAKLRDSISQLEAEARRAAEAGEIDVSARTVLQLLACERRLAAIGPQVLQVIKPRA